MCKFCGSEDIFEDTGEHIGMLPAIKSEDYSPDVIYFVDAGNVSRDKWYISVYKGTGVHYEHVHPIHDLGANVWIPGVDGSAAYRFHYCPVCGRNLMEEK